MALQSEMQCETNKPTCCCTGFEKQTVSCDGSNCIVLFLNLARAVNSTRQCQTAAPELPVNELLANWWKQGQLGERDIQKAGTTQEIYTLLGHSVIQARTIVSNPPEVFCFLHVQSQNVVTKTKKVSIKASIRHRKKVVICYAANAY